MKPAWDKLMAEVNSGPNAKSALVADVDCTTGGKPLCQSNGVKGYPTIKHGDPNNLEDYKGGRDFNSLKKFADENLKPVCSPSNIDLCDDAMKAKIAELQAMSADQLSAAIAEKNKENEKAEADFKKGVEGLNTQYKALMATKEAALAKVKASGLGLMKAVQSASKK